MSNEKYDTAVVGLALAALDGAQMMIDHLRKDKECVTAELAAARLEIESLQGRVSECGAGAGCCAQAARIEELEAQLEAVGAPAQPVGVLAAKAAVHDAVEAAAIQLISRLTGMAPPPLECAPPEVTAPFKQFADEVMAAIGAAAPQPAAQAQPVATIYVTEDGNREVDDWKVELPVGATTLYIAAQAQQGDTV